MAYSYKKDFLGKWMKKNGITPYALAEVLHLKSTNNILMWAGINPPRATKKEPKEDQEWLPLIHILRLCNHYPELRMSDFIENVEEPKLKKRKVASVNDDAEAVRREYEKRLADQERLMRTTIDAQRETIEAMKVTIEALRGTQKNSDHRTLTIAADDEP